MVRRYIGEDAKFIDDELRDAAPDVPWSDDAWAAGLSHFRVRPGR